MVMKREWKWIGVVAVVLVMTFVLGVYPDQERGAAKAAQKPSVVSFGYASPDLIVFWDPSDTYSNEIVAMNNFYEQLVRYDSASDKVYPVLAEKWDTSSDGLVWTFYLKKGVKFHSGDEMTAEDVKFSIDRTMQRGKGAAYIWGPVKAIDVVDKYTVKFTLEYPAPLDMIASAGYCAHIFSKKYTEARGKEKGDDGHKWFAEGNECGTGPYKLESHSKAEIVMKKFDDYWGGWEGKHFDIAVIRAVPERSTARQMLEAGQLDLVHNLPIEMIGALEKNPNIEIVRTPSFQNLFGLMNTQKPPMDNKLVRQAVSYAFPYKTVIDHVWKGNATQSKGAITKGLWGHCENIMQYKQDLTKAKELLKQAGFPDGGFKLTLTYNSGDEGERKTAELFKPELAKLGIDLEIRGMPWESQWSLAKATNPKERQDIFLFYWWPDYPDPISWLQSMFHSEEKVTFNLSYYSDKKVDELIDEGSRISGVDRNKATNLYCEAQSIFVDDAVALFVWDQMYIRPKLTSLKGYKDNPVYPHVIFFYDLYRE